MVMSVRTKYEFLVNDINSTKTWILISVEIRVITRKLLFPSCFETVLMTCHYYQQGHICARLKERLRLLISVLIFVTVTKLHADIAKRSHSYVRGCGWEHEEQGTDICWAANMSRDHARRKVNGLQELQHSMTNSHVVHQYIHSTHSL